MSKSESRNMWCLVITGMGIILLALAVAGCGSGPAATSAAGQEAAARSAAGAPSGTGASPTSSPATETGSSGGAGAGGTTPSSAAPSGTASTAGQSTRSTGTTATTAAPVHSTTPSTTPPTTAPSAGVSGPAPAVLGTYHYHQAGSLPGTPAEGTLVVTPGSKSGTEVWTRNVGGSLPPATTNMLFTASGAFLLAPSDPVTGSASCTFAQPVPWPPYPTTPGRSASAQATCTAPITTYQVSSQVQGTTQVSLGGVSVTAAIVVNTFVIKGSYNGGAINVTMTETDEYASSVAVPVVTTTRMSGTALGLSVSTERTDTLESATPS